MVLGCDIVQALRSTKKIQQHTLSIPNEPSTYYFSTHGCRFWVSLGATFLREEAPLVAPAAARALLSKKLAIALAVSYGKGINIDIMVQVEDLPVFGKTPARFTRRRASRDHA